MKIEIEEIDPELFIRELYDSSMLQSLEGWELAKYAIGYCDAGRLYVRPKSGELALMCELPNGEKCWSHIDSKMLRSLNWRRETGRGMAETIDATESKECYGDHFKCDKCNIVKPGWKSACKKQCEYNWEHRNSHIARSHDDDGWDIAGQYQTSY